MAKDIIKRAMAGDENAMFSLYGQNKTKVMCLCQALLLDENKADNATACIFKNIFEELIGGRISSEDEFLRLLVRRAIIYCKAKTVQKDTRAFRTPVNSSFIINPDTDIMNFDGEHYQSILKNLPSY